MKTYLVWISYIILFSIILVLVKTNYEKQQQLNKNLFEIRKENGTYEIYKLGELKSEFNKRNTDSLSLETLEFIYSED